MKTRERFLALMNFEPVDRTLKWAAGYYRQKLKHIVNPALTRKRYPSDRKMAG